MLSRFPPSEKNTRGARAKSSTQHCWQSFGTPEKRSEIVLGIDRLRLWCEAPCMHPSAPRVSPSIRASAGDQHGRSQHLHLALTEGKTVEGKAIRMSAWRPSWRARSCDSRVWTMLRQHARGSNMRQAGIPICNRNWAEVAHDSWHYLKLGISL